jgi:hypothetical protein
MKKSSSEKNPEITIVETPKSPITEIDRATYILLGIKERSTKND